MEGEAWRHRCVLETAFGESSDSDDDAFSSTTEDDKLYRWEPVDRIDGLWLCREFLPERKQNLLLEAISRGLMWCSVPILFACEAVCISMTSGCKPLEGWFTESSHNQAMRFGDLPDWATDLVRLIQKAACFGETIPVEDLESGCKESQMEESCPLPFDLLWREPLFDQLIANVYQPGEGICAHIDLMRFEDGIAIVSLESECVMHFSKKDEKTNNGYEEASSVVKIPILLYPGSLVLMSGEARYAWQHEINRKPGFQNWMGMEISQKRRTSLTLRRLSHSTSHHT